MKARRHEERDGTQTTSTDGHRKVCVMAEPPDSFCLAFGFRLGAAQRLPLLNTQQIVAIVAAHIFNLRDGQAGHIPTHKSLIPIRGTVVPPGLQ
jgi:hypothetical protein